ncbi:MAG: LysR substrate-binding domain-containing protein, partial [Burkholderiales bacterium]
NPLVLIAPGDFRPPRGRFSLADLAGERFLLRETGSGTRMAVDEYLARHRIKLANRMTLGSNEAIKQAVAGGMGLAVLSRHALTEADLHEVRLLPARDFPLAGVWHIVHWRDKHLSAAAQAFLDFLRDHAGVPAGANQSRNSRSKSAVSQCAKVFGR